MSVRDDVVSVLPAWLTARVLVGASFILGEIVSDELTGERTQRLSDGLVGWDGQWYRGIAEHGYDGIALEGVRFFPAYPLLARSAAWIVRDFDVALVVVANVAALLLAVLIRRLVLLETSDESLAERAVWVTMLFPSSFVLVWGYSEPLMLVCVVGAFLAARSNRWWLVVPLGLLAGLSRPLGVVLAVPLLIEALSTSRTSNRLAKVVAVGSAPLGASVYLVWASVHFDDFLIPLTVQEEFRGDPVNPLRRVIDGFGDLVGPEALGDGLHIPFAVLFVALAVLTFRAWRMSYAVFAAVLLLVALASDNLNSLERYGLNAFPLLLTLGVVAGYRKLETPIIAISAVGLVSLSLLAATGAYVP